MDTSGFARRCRSGSVDGLFCRDEGLEAIGPPQTPASGLGGRTPLHDRSPAAWDEPIVIWVSRTFCPTTGSWWISPCAPRRRSSRGRRRSRPETFWATAPGAEQGLPRRNLRPQKACALASSSFSPHARGGPAPRHLRHILVSSFVTQFAGKLTVGASLPRMSPSDLRNRSPCAASRRAGTAGQQLARIDQEIVALRARLAALPAQQAEGLGRAFDRKDGDRGRDGCPALEQPSQVLLVVGHVCPQQRVRPEAPVFGLDGERLQHGLPPAFLN